MLLCTAGWYAAGSGQERTDNAQIECDTSGVPAQVSGVVARIAFVDDQYVREGDVLAELDPAAQRVGLAQSEANLVSMEKAALVARAEAELAIIDARADRALSTLSVDVASADRSSLSREIESARALVEIAKVERQRAYDDLERERRLFDREATSRDALERAQIAFDTSRSRLKAAQARKAVMASSREAASSRVVENETRAARAISLEDGIVARARAQQQLAEARVTAAQAARDAAALDLDHTTIVAPRSGTASNRTIAIGQMVGEGQPVVSVVSCSERSWVEANFKETQLAQMQPGQRAHVEVDAYPGVVLEGRVRSISGGTGAIFSLLPPENATGNFTKVVQRVPVQIDLVDPPAEYPMRAGMSVVVSVDTESRGHTDE